MGRAAGPGVEYAGIPRRAVAYAIDIGIMAAISITLTTLLAWPVLGGPWWVRPWSDPAARWQPGAGERYLAYLVVSTVVNVVVELGYFLAFWTRGSGATLGMRILGLRIVRAADGGLLARSAAARRWLAMGSWLGTVTLVPGIGDALVLVWPLYVVVLAASTWWSPVRRGLHDRVAGTAVLEPAPPTGRPLAVGCLVLALLWGVLLIGMVFLVLGHG